MGPAWLARELGLLPAELRTLRSLNSPVKIQKFIDGLAYQYADTAGRPGCCGSGGALPEELAGARRCA